MNILFLTMSSSINLNSRGIYNDLINDLASRGNTIYVVAPTERREKLNTYLSDHNEIKILKVKTLNLTKSTKIEKGIGQVLMEKQYLKAIKRYFSNIKFDLVLYSTPPITFTKVINFIKKRDNAYTYLLLKDIFPQNAVDLGFIKKNSLLHRYFVKKEKNLYLISDTIGCMSEANRKYIIDHNPEIQEMKVEVNPNSILPNHISYSDYQKNEVRDKYNLPLNKKIFVYGGNLGVPQGLDFLIETIKKIKNAEVFFLIVGAGTQFSKLKLFFEQEQPENAVLLNKLPKADYDLLLASCDVGMIFLDKRFTIPNFPSRLLAYLEMKKPILAATDKNTDIGKVIEGNKCGYWVESGDLRSMEEKIKKICSDNFQQLQENCWELLQRDYLVGRSSRLIESKIQCTNQL
ncbi:MAG: glycosyltransferase family 4 protein [Bacteroidota bacterium]